MSSGMDWVCKKMRRSPRLTGWAPASELLGVELVGAKGGCSRDRARCFGPVWLASCKFRQVLQRVTNGRSGVGGLERRRPTGRDAAALALDSSLFHQTPAPPPHLPCATIRCGGRPSCSHTPHHTLYRRVCLPTRPPEDLEVPSVETRPGLAPSRASSVRQWVTTWWWVPSSSVTGQRM
jgi:hypothetical protein